MTFSPPPLCVHNAHPDMCPFCKAEQELEEHPELAQVTWSAHEFGCPLFENPHWAELAALDFLEAESQRANYRRVYGGDTCTCKPDPQTK